jgi:uncharacterized membrane protein YfcA
MQLSPAGFMAIAGAGLAAGLVNALAGGGSLISFPVLTALGLPSVIANASNTVALSPGYGGAALAQHRELRGQKGRLLWLLPAASLGGLLGAWLLLSSGERVFRSLVPWMILLGAVLLALQDPLATWLPGRRQSQGPGVQEAWSLTPVLLASVYGGYFGAGLSVILLAVLGLCLEDSLPRLNGLKQAIALAANLSASLLFLGLGRIEWSVTLVLALGASAGGALGGRLASRIDPTLLRRLVIGTAVAVAVAFFLKG